MKLLAFEQTERDKLDGITAGAEVNNISNTDATDLTDSGESTLHYHASDRDRANHTGTQLAATISDFDTEVSNNTTVAANTAKVSASGSVTTHSDVTSAGSGDIITTIERSKLGGIEPLAEVNNISNTDATDLTDGGETTLHSHAIPINPYLVAYMSTNLTFDTALEEKIITIDTTTGSSGVSVVAGEFEVDTDGEWITNLTMQIKETSDPTFIVWFEVKPLATGVWELANGGVDKMNLSKLKTDQNWTMFISDSLHLLAGDKYRIVGMSRNPAPDKVELIPVSQVVALGTLTQNSAFVDVIRISG